MRVDMREAKNFRTATEGRAKKNAVLGVAPGARLAWQMQDLHPEGAAGDAANATAEKGRKVIDFAAAKIATLLAEAAAFDLAALDNPPAWS